MKISIPQPCLKDWQEMTPNERGRFCASCQKTVVDFTGWTDKELIEFFQKKDNNVCGKFRVDQLNINTLAEQPLISRRHHLPTVAAISLMYLIAAPLPANAQNHSKSTVLSEHIDSKDIKKQEEHKNIGSGIKGTITDDRTGEIISGAAIQLSNAHQHIISDTYSDTNGHFVFNNLKPGHYKISVKLLSYNELASQLFEVFDDKFTTVNFPLAENVMGLTVVTVTYPEKTKYYWLKHPWKFLKTRIFKTNPT